MCQLGRPRSLSTPVLVPRPPPPSGPANSWQETNTCGTFPHLFLTIRFGGLLTTEFLEPPPGRCFLFRQTYKHQLDGTIPDNLRKLIESVGRPKGPLLHFHQFQTEYFKVESGIMGIEVNGEHRKVYPEDGEVSVKAGAIHRFYIHPDSPGDMTVFLSASDSGLDYQLDRVFFENWYGYWHDALLHEGRLDFIQYLAVSYQPSLPKFLHSETWILEINTSSSHQAKTI